jgi:hypothetical protein
MTSTSEIDKDSHYRRISFVEGLSKERFYQLGQFIRSENAYVHSIKDTSYLVPDTDILIRKFTISLITKELEVYDWYEFEKGLNDSVVLQLNTKYIEV